MAVSNEIVLENLKSGNPVSEWGLNSGASKNIEGFSSDISVDIGERVDFKISTDAAHYRIDIYRLGSYGGDGARLVATIEHLANQATNQPDPLFDPATHMSDAGNWMVTDGWDVPDDAVSGVYIAKLVREDGIAGENHIPFIIRDDDGASDVVFQTSDTTWQAYNNWGGTNLYGADGGQGILDRAYAVSYNRPIQTATPNTFLDAEFAAINFLEANGFDVSYISGVDTARSGSELLEHKLFLSVGHDEYWAGEQRDNVEAARDAGVNLAFWSGNEVYWKTRWETSIDASGTPYRTMVCYKESWPSTSIDPSSEWTSIDPSSEWTGLFRDDRAPSGADPENSLTGTLFKVNGYRRDTISVSDAFSDLRFWANTRVALLNPGQTTQLAPGTLGYEWDINPTNVFRPEGLINLSSTIVNVNEYIGSTDLDMSNANAVHNLTLYRAPSGALVFGAGTVFWSWALDSHNPQNSPADPALQQAMINLLADMGIQPSTLRPGLVHASQSTDYDAPTTTFTGVGLAIVGQDTMVYGHSVDAGGGVIAGNVLSIGDGNWYYANGGEDWSCAWVFAKAGSVQLLARAIDDSLNLGDVTEITVDVTEITVNVSQNLIMGTNLRHIMGTNHRDVVGDGLKGRHSTSGNDAIFGKKGFDSIKGGAGDDWIDGGSGNDTIVGGMGQDVLIGRSGKDRFIFRAAIESTAAAPDSIVDFQTGLDKIDLRGFRAHFINGTDFSGTAGELRFDNTQQQLEADFDGNGVADFAIKLGASQIAMHDLLL